jgi:hypothetical protein
METNDKAPLDRWLDGALQQYGNAEPRAGLEHRILANLESADKRARVDLGWWWRLAVAAVMICIVVAVWMGRNVSRVAKQSIAKVVPATRIVATTKPPEPNPALGKVATTTTHPARRRESRPRIPTAKEPRLEQFPSARPLSEQEQMLSHYVRDFPQQAVLVAQAQAERQKELAKLVADESSEIGSDQQER